MKHHAESRYQTFTSDALPKALPSSQSGDGRYVTSRIGWQPWGQCAPRQRWGERGEAGNDGRAATDATRPRDTRGDVHTEGWPELERPKAPRSDAPAPQAATRAFSRYIMAIMRVRWAPNACECRFCWCVAESVSQRSRKADAGNQQRAPGEEDGEQSHHPFCAHGASNTSFMGERVGAGMAGATAPPRNAQQRPVAPGAHRSAQQQSKKASSVHPA